MGSLIIKFFIVFVWGSMILCMGCSHRIPAGMPIRVSTNNRLTADDMITAFYQGKAGNCATISVIKAAMLKYGPDSVIFCEKKNGCYKVILHNKSDFLLITNAEIDTLNAKDKFIAGTDTNIYNKARFLYAVVVKRKFQDTTGKRYKSVSAAADALNGGENLGSRNIFPLLGLTASKTIDLTDISKHCNLIITSKFHSAFSSEGYYDEYGGKAMVSDFKYNHKRGLLFWQSANVTDAFYIMP